MRSALLALLVLHQRGVVAQNGLDPSGSYVWETRGFDLDSATFIGPGGGITIERLEDGRHAVDLSVCRGWPSYNLGELQDTVVFAGDSAILRTPFDSVCAITVRCSGERLVVTQRPDEDMACGFGHAVFADGTYRRVVEGHPSPAWYDTVHVDCLAPLRTVALHKASLTAADMDLLCNAFHPACKENVAFRERADELFHTALRQDPVAFMAALDRAQEHWQLPYVLYILAERVEEDGVDEALRDKVAEAAVPNEWVRQRIVRALEGAFD